MDFDPTDASPEELESNGYPKDYNEMTAPQQEAFQRQLNGGVWDHQAPGFERLTDPEYVAPKEPDFEAGDEFVEQLKAAEPVNPAATVTTPETATHNANAEAVNNRTFGMGTPAPVPPAAPEQPTLI